MKKIKSFVVAHKIISTIIIVVILGIVYLGYKKITSTSGDTRYITAKVEKGTIIAIVSGTGQVSADNQIDLKPKVSGEVVYLGAKNGDKVWTGALIAQLDTKDANKTVRDAEQNLASQQLSLDKLKIQNSSKNISADLKKAYADGLSEVSDTFLDLPVVLNGLEDLFAENNLSDNATSMSGRTARSYRDKAEASYYNAKKLFNQNKKKYVVLDTNSSEQEIEEIITETLTTTKSVADAIKDMLDFVNFMADDSNDSAAFTSSQSTLATYTKTIATHLSALTTVDTNINDARDSSENADIDIRSAELALQQRQNALQDAKDNLADYFIRAPYAGTVANMTISKGDQASGSTIIASLITDKQLAEISMNEVDVAKIKIGQKATLTFDAIPDLTISGVVSEIDSIGTVSQGVVTYNVKINFDTQDNQVKPSMSVSAAIITDMKQDVLRVPNSAVKSQSGQSYVEAFDTSLSPPTDGLIGSISKIAPNKIPVEVGLSSDSESEIISGINEGDEIVVRTILPSATAKAPAPSLFGNTGGTRATTGGGNVRVPAGR